MNDFIAPNTREGLKAIAADLAEASAKLTQALAGEDPAAFVTATLDLDEQISRARLLVPLCTFEVTVHENGRMLSLSDLIMETREEFDSLARAQIEVLAEEDKAS
ncbi:hypothetical protein EON80_04125 [bacterium]|nr:MAG: hypothetical protein EON80_04125 [bacterium]